MSLFIPPASVAMLVAAIRADQATELAKINTLPAIPAAASEYTAAIAAIPTAAQNRIEMDTNSIGLAMIADVPTLAEIVAANIPVNVKEVNDVEVIGTGTTLDPWGPV